MRVLFLDFDGVLNSDPYWHSIGLYGRRVPKRKEELALDPIAVARLNRILAATGAVVVISSSWRSGRSIDRLRYLLGARGFQGSVVDTLPDWSKPELALLYMAKERGDEICDWLERHPEVTAFVALDDASDMGAVQGRLVQTTMAQGLADRDVALAIAILETPLSPQSVADERSLAPVVTADLLEPDAMQLDPSHEVAFGLDPDVEPF